MVQQNILNLYAFIAIFCSFQLSSTKQHNYEIADWDYIMFSQRWPYSSCTEWMEKNPNNTCNLPEFPIWEIHGMWPTKTGTEGPNNCDSAIHFDVTQLEPIMPELEQFWINVEANTKPLSFWKHEWNKHGTCATSLPQLNSIYNYFSKGLEWAKAYNISQILSGAKIVPNSNGYTVEDIFDSIKENLSVVPQIECVVDKEKSSLLSEIRLCFNKSFDLIDCEFQGRDGNDSISTNCSKKKPVMYYTNTTLNLKRKELNSNNYLLNIYSILRFLIWFSL